MKKNTHSTLSHSLSHPPPSLSSLFISSPPSYHRLAIPSCDTIISPHYNLLQLYPPLEQREPITTLTVNMPMVWNEAADAKVCLSHPRPRPHPSPRQSIVYANMANPQLLVGILATTNAKLDMHALASYMGTGM